MHEECTLSMQPCYARALAAVLQYAHAGCTCVIESSRTNHHSAGGSPPGRRRGRGFFGVNRPARARDRFERPGHHSPTNVPTYRRAAREPSDYQPSPTITIRCDQVRSGATCARLDLDFETAKSVSRDTSRGGVSRRTFRRQPAADPRSRLPAKGTALARHARTWRRPAGSRRSGLADDHRPLAIFFRTSAVRTGVVLSTQSRSMASMYRSTSSRLSR